MTVKKDIYTNPPETKKQYGEWIVIGPPLPSLTNKMEREYQSQWQVPCECRCGRRDLVNVLDLESGESTQCVVCDRLGFLESLSMRTGKPSKALEAFGEIKRMCDWVKDPRCGCKHTRTIYDRLKKGMSPEEAITGIINATLKVLTDDQVKEIHIRANSKEKNIDLAKEFGVSPTIISRVKLGKY